MKIGIKRLACKIICFLKSEQLNDTVIGLFIKRYKFGQTVYSSTHLEYYSQEVARGLKNQS
jgi:hypothetical protein